MCVALLPLTAQDTSGLAGVLEGQHYHHNLSGVEFELPAGWSIGITKPVDGNPNETTVLVDPDGRTIFASVTMFKLETPPASINQVLSRMVPQLVARRAGSVPPHGVPKYKIQEGSLQQTSIGGNQAVRAIGEYELGGQKINELLAWIVTEHTRTYFFAKITTDDFSAIKFAFDLILQSARIP